MRNKGVAIGLLAILLAFGAFYVYTIVGSKKVIKKPAVENNQPAEPQFRHDGSLTFYRNGPDGRDSLGHFDIEIADDEYEITTGLMYRKHMEANHGMLFTFPDSRMRSFWMRNTVIPLDIIFINSSHLIVNIQSNTVPFSEKSIPSTGEAKYVLEINAGRAAQLGLQPGDQMDWSRSGK